MAGQVFRGRAAGAFGSVGGEIYVDWVPDPSIVANDIVNIAAYLDDIIGPLELSREIIRRDVRSRFVEQSDPDGVAWTEWSESYEPYALRRNLGRILEQSTMMREAATSERAYVVSTDSVFFDTAVFAATATKSDPQGLRWVWHNEGRERGGAPATAEEIKELQTFAGITSASTAKRIVELQKGGASNTLPARPFLGLSFEAEIQIAETFDQWFDGAIRLGVSSSGRKFGRHAKRGAGGRFVPRNV